MNTHPLRVAIDGRVLVMKPTGIGHYTRSLLGTMARMLGPQFEAAFFTHQRIFDQSFWPRQMEQRILRFPDPMLFRPLWDHRLLPRAIRNAGPFDLYFSPLSVVPRNLPIPSVATVHDLAFFHYPEVQPWKYRHYWKKAIRRTAKDATRIIAVSESTRQDLNRFYPGTESKTKVIHEASSTLFHASSQGGSFSHHRIDSSTRYFLSVGTLEPRKNYPFLLEVFRHLLKRPGCEELKLVIAGSSGWESAELEKAIEDRSGHLIRLDYVEYSELPDLYRGAIALVFPSLYEGFGLPAIEAMTVGTPVIASNVSSFPEVIGEAGILLDLEDGESWVDTLERVAKDEAWRVRLASRCLARSKEFTWERAAEETWQIFQEAAND